MARKIVATAYGEPREVLSVIDVEPPVPADGEVVVEIRAAGLNPFDVKKAAGVMGDDPSKLPLSLGNEASGVVHAAADGTGFAPGDEVVVQPVTGGFADYAAAPAANVHRKPAGVPFEKAAGLLLAGTTAADTVETLAPGADDVVLVHGGAGAVGSIAVVLAAARGATVVATASEDNHDYVRSLGGIPVTYGDGLLDAVRAAAPSPVTGVIDTVGNDETIDVSEELVAPGRIVSTAAWGRADDGLVLVDGSTDESRKHRREAVAPLLAALADGRIDIEIAGSYSFDDAAEAFEALSGPHPRGKYVLHP